MMIKAICLRPIFYKGVYCRVGDFRLFEEGAEVPQNHDGPFFKVVGKVDKEGNPSKEDKTATMKNIEGLQAMHKLPDDLVEGLWRDAEARTEKQKLAALKKFVEAK